MKIKLSDLLPARNTYCVKPGMIALLLKQIDDEILADDVKNKDGQHFLGECSHTFTLSCVNEYLHRYIARGYEYQDKEWKKVEISKHLFDYKFLDEKVALYKIGARRDSDEFYPIIQIFGICECESEKEYDKDYLLSEITRTYKCLLNIIDLCFCVFWFMDDPKDKKQFHIYDVIDYQSNLCESVFNVKEYLQEKYDFVVTKEGLIKQGGINGIAY